MLFELVHVESGESDLHGLIRRVENHRGLVIHVHGTWGNFYENSFIEPMAHAYEEAGYSFASLNFPGHDGTAVFEKIEQFSPAFTAWCDELNTAGSNLILQGHSLGAIKISYLLSQNQMPRGLAGVVLLAPFDAVAFNSRGYNGDTDALHRKLADLKQIGETMVPGSIFEYWPISIDTLSDLITPSGVWDQFPTRKHSVGLFANYTEVPVFAAVGSADFAATPSPAEVVSLFSQSTSTSATLIDGAPHNFAGQEPALMSELSKWLRVSGLAS